MTKDIDSFVQLSALLTGFARDIIAPVLDETNLKALFYDTAQTGAGQAFTDLLASFKAMPATPADQDAVARALLGLGPDPVTGATQPETQTQTAQAIMKLWYLGSWYQPFDLNGAKAGTETVVSDQAYVKGLAWQAMQSHAMGNSTFTFGYWAEPPAADLDVFTGHTKDA